MGGGHREGRSDSITSLAPCCGTACQQHPYTIRIQELAQQLDQACLRTYTESECMKCPVAAGRISSVSFCLNTPPS